MAIAFREPLMNFVSWLWNWGQPVRDFWAGLWNGVVQLATTSIGKLGEFFRAWGAEIAKIWSGDFSTLLGIVDGWWKAVQSIWAQIPRFFAGVWSRSQQLASAFFKWLTSTVSSGFKAVTTAIDNLFVKPWVLMWNKGIREPVTAAQEWLRSSVFEPLGKAFATYVTEPITNGWRVATQFLQSAMANVGNFVQGLWTAMVGSIQNAVRGMLTFVATAANRVRSLINVLIGAYNRLASAVGGTTLSLIGEITIPAFAKGGTVDKPTLALVGEGGEREYIIPESKMQAASSRFLGGARGADVIPSSSASTSTAPSSTSQINITTGPVMQQQDGSRWVSIEDFERGLQDVAEQVVGTLRTPQARTALGWSY
jgi:phage-related protein